MFDPEFLVQETAHLGAAQLAAATNSTFTGYFTPISHTPAGFAAFCRWFHIDLAQSVLLEHADGRLAGLTMLALRGARAWCGGFGIVPEFRGHGLSAVLVNALVSRACSLSLCTLQLEVLTQNEKAIKAYAHAGFETRRDLVILSGEAGARLGLLDTTVDVSTASAAEAMGYAELSLSGPQPCWQREAVSLLSMEDIHTLIARRAGDVVGVLLYRTGVPSGPLSILHLTFSDEDTACTLLAHASAATGLTSLFILNEPENSPAHCLLLSLGLREIHRQHEMIVTL